MKIIKKKKLLSVIALALYLLAITPAFSFAQTWNSTNATYGGSNATTPGSVTAVTWSNSLGTVRAEVFEVIGATDFISQNPIIVYPLKFVEKYGVNVDVKYTSNFLIINSTTKHKYNNYIWSIKEFANY